jgi:copper chaperone
MEHKLEVKDMMCGNCAAKIRQALEQVDGVERIDIVVERKQVVVHGTAPASVVSRAITSAGFTPA